MLRGVVRFLHVCAAGFIQTLRKYGQRRGGSGGTSEVRRVWGGVGWRKWWADAIDTIDKHRNRAWITYDENVAIFFVSPWYALPGLVRDLYLQNCIDACNTSIAGLYGTYTFFCLCFFLKKTQSNWLLKKANTRYRFMSAKLCCSNSKLGLTTAWDENQGVSNHKK